jgi:hypothetical protein
MNRVTEAMEVYMKIKEEQYNRQKPLPRNAYSQLLIAFANKGDINNTEKILKDMAFDNVNPSRSVQVIMKKMYQMKGLPDRTMELYRQFRKLRPSQR